jgi:CubicO group peptidase (beta-lactamase class C family)
MRRSLASLSAGIALGLSAVASAASAAGPTCPAKGFLSEAQATIRDFDQAGAFTGALLVAMDGKPVLRQGVGLADRELGVAATPETKFRIGSITKQFTATAILQLQEAGKLAVDDPISKYYPEAPPAWAKITLRHLLTHTSGIPSYTGLPGFFDREARLPHTPEELIRLTRDKPLEFEPGAKYAYDNSGYILLGYVVEKASGERYADYVQKHIFGPLGMTASGYDSSEQIMPGRAQGYERAPSGGLRNAAFLDMSVPYSAGSLYSTVDDLLAWDRALYAATLLKPDSLKAMWTDYGHHYGFGFTVDRKWDQDRIWHNGGINGFTSSFQRYPKARVTAVALANQASPAADALAADLAGLCLGAEVFPKSIAAKPAELARYAGYYEITPVNVLRLEVQGGALRATGPDQPGALFHPAGGGKFFSRTSAVRIAFQTGPDGLATGALVDQAGHQVLAKAIDATEADRLAKAKAARVASGAAASGSEEALRKVVADLQKGEPDYDRLSPPLAAVMRQRLDQTTKMMAVFGPLKSLQFTGVGPGGADIYRVEFEKAATEWRIALAPDGKIAALTFRPAS